MNRFTADDYNDYVIAIESTSEGPIEILKDEKNSDGVKFLRFRACLQAFVNRNRNRRKWYSKFTRPMFEAPEIKELLREGGVPGENGHPVPDSGQVTIERILTIDPNNISHVIKEYIWPNEDRVDGIIETIDDTDGPGSRFRKNILQGLPVSFSTRSVIPQRKEPDGLITQTGPGRYVTSDRVFLPSHPEAYIDKTVPVKDICKKGKFEQVMESYSAFVAETSDKVSRLLDHMDPVMDAVTFDNDGMLNIPTTEGTVGIYPELKYRDEFFNLMSNL